MKVVIATKNQGKLKEFLYLAQESNYEFTMLSESTSSPDETGNNFYENALIKAEHALNVTGLTALADDSGLEVDCLNGQPGIFSSRFSYEGTDEANNKKLLNIMKETKEEDRTARFRCCLVFLEQNKDPLSAEGTLEGRIAIAESGSHGFGYDPIFFIPHLNSHLAELTKEEKNKISHRSAAWKKLMMKLA